MPGRRRGFAERYPAVTVHQSERHQAALFEALRMARIEVAFCYDLNIPADPGFQPLVSLPPYAQFDPGHDLAARPSVPLSGPVRPMRMGLMLVAGARPTPAAAAFVAHCRAEITPASAPGPRPADDQPRQTP